MFYKSQSNNLVYQFTVTIALSGWGAQRTLNVHNKAAKIQLPKVTECDNL